MRGEVATRWRKTASGLRLDVTVPANATGVVHVPATRPRDVSVKPRGDGSVRLLGVRGGRVVYEVGSGRYRFRTPR